MGGPADCPAVPNAEGAQAAIGQQAPQRNGAAERTGLSVRRVRASLYMAPDATPTATTS